MNTQTTQPRPQSTSNVINQNSTKPKSNEEDLEIPAFIRKKMGM